jgi:hypothetical protein
MLSPVGAQARVSRVPCVSEVPSPVIVDQHKLKPPVFLHHHVSMMKEELRRATWESAQIVQDLLPHNIVRVLI